nr:hypothetical protein [Tanacetum cinerariifolium]
MDLSDIEVPRVFVTCRTTGDYYTRYCRHPRIVDWSSKHKFYRHMLKPMLHGQLPVERLVPYETEARSRWWVSSRAYFDGRSFEDEQIPRHLNRNNYFEVTSEMYREFEEHRRGYQQMKEKNDDIYGKMTRFIEDIRRVPEANTTPIIADQHFGVSDISGFQSYQGVPSALHTLANNSSFFNMATPSNLQTPNQSNWLSPSKWQTPNPSYLGTPNSQPPIPSQPGTSNWQKPGDISSSGCWNIGPDDVTITGVQQTDNYFNYETVDPDKHMDSWIQILIRERTEMSIGTCLNRVYMPINARGVHWVTGAINLADSIFYVFDSMKSESRMLMLEQQVNNWTPVINIILEKRGYFNGPGRQPHNF